jgi:hypothetical protein
MLVKSVFDDVKDWFGKVFTKAPSWTVAALSSINVVAPEAELVLALVDPAASVIVTPIITEVTADLGTVATMLKNGNITNLGTFLTSIKTNLSGLLTAGHITDPASVTKATGIVDAIIGVVDSIAGQLAAAV